MDTKTAWQTLRDYAEGRINHANAGSCPDGIEGPAVRDSDCPVCQALDAVQGCLAQIEEPARKVHATAPERIYLQGGPQLPPETEFGALSEVTWCRDDVDGAGIPYVRADLAGAAPAAVAGPAREEIAVLRAEHGITSSGRGIKEFEQVDAFVRAVLQRWGAAPALEAPAAPDEMSETEASQRYYQGNSVSYIKQKLDAYRGAIDRAFDVLRGAGHHPDGKTELAEVIRAALAAAPQAPDCTRCSGSGEDPEGYLTHGRGPDDHTADGPCRSCDGAGAAPQAPAAPVAISAPPQSNALTPAERETLAFMKTDFPRRARVVVKCSQGEWHGSVAGWVARGERVRVKRDADGRVINWWRGQVFLAPEAAPAAPAVDADPLGLRDVGEALMKTIERNADALKAAGWTAPMDCPSEIVVDLLNLLDEAKAAPAVDASDTALLDALAAEYLDLRCFDIPAGQGDADVGWRVLQHHMGEPTERVVSEVYKDDPRSAIRAAIARLERDPYCTGPLHEADAARAAQAKEGGA